MTTHHTPGPWTLGADHLLLIESQTTREPIAEVLPNGTPQQIRANARLIASAPDLLAACQEMLVDYRQCGMENREVVSVAKTAIARAKGLDK